MIYFIFILNYLYVDLVFRFKYWWYGFFVLLREKGYVIIRFVKYFV